MLNGVVVIPDSKRESADHQGGEPGRAAQAHDRVLDVIEEIRQPVDASHLSHLLFPLFEPAHRANRV